MRASAHAGGTGQPRRRRPSDVETVAFGYAQALAAKPPEAVRTARRLLRGDRREVLTRIDQEANGFTELLRSPAARDALQAFLDRKDDADFTRRPETALTTLLVTDPIFLEHLVPTGHPERPDRLRAIERALADERFAGLERQRRAAPADEAVLATAHDEAYVAAIRDGDPDRGLRPARRRHVRCRRRASSPPRAPPAPRASPSTR